MCLHGGAAVCGTYSTGPSESLRLSRFPRFDEFWRLRAWHVVRIQIKSNSEKILIEIKHNKNIALQWSWLIQNHITSQRLRFSFPEGPRSKDSRIDRPRSSARLKSWWRQPLVPDVRHRMCVAIVTHCARYLHKIMVLRRYKVLATVLWTLLMILI